MSPKIVDKKLKRKELIEAAVAVFACKGFQRASMGEIAVRADMGKGTIYEYFRNKEDLFYACFDWFEQITMDQVVDALAKCPDAVDKLQTLARVSVESTNQYIDFYPLTLEVWAMASTGAARERFAASLKKTYTAFRAIIEEILYQGQASGDLRQDMDVPAIAALLVGAYDGAMLQAWFDRSMNITSYMNNFTGVLIRGMQTGQKD